MALAQQIEQYERIAPSANEERILNHLISVVERTPLDTDPFCHIYNEGMLPADTYAEMLANFPDPKLYSPLNLRLYSRGNGVSTRDQFFLTPSEIAKLPQGMQPLWTDIAGAFTRAELRKALFGKLAPDIALRFGVSETAAANMGCNYEVLLVRDTEDYTIKPHPDGLNKIVTMQFYLPPDMSQLDLGTSLYHRNKGFFTSTFDEVKRFEFRPNSAYAFAVSDSPTKQSWHGRKLLTGFKGVRNTLMLLFQQKSPRIYAVK